MTINRIRRLIRRLDRRNRDETYEQLTDFLVQAYPTRRAQDN